MKKVIKFIVKDKIIEEMGGVDICFTYILKIYGTPAAVIITDKEDNEKELQFKVYQAIKEEVSADVNTQFSLEIGEFGDWGEDTDIKVSYVVDGSLIEDNEFTLMKCVNY